MFSIHGSICIPSVFKLGMIVDCVGFNATLTAEVISCQADGDANMCVSLLSHTSTTTSLKRHQLLFSHASAEVRGENTPERKAAATGYRTHNHQAMLIPEHWR